MRKIILLQFSLGILLAAITGCGRLSGLTGGGAFHRLDVAELLFIADEHAQQEGYDLDEYQEPELIYDTEKEEWDVYYEQVYAQDPETGEPGGAPGKDFSVIVDATTGEVIELMRGK